MRGFALLFLMLSAKCLLSGDYSWLEKYPEKQVVCESIPLPVGFERAPVKEGSFGSWLRKLPLAETGSALFKERIKLKNIQESHHSIVDIDQERVDVQTGMGAVLRLRAEYLYDRARYKDITFKTNCDYIVNYTSWMDGYRPARLDRNQFVLDLTARSEPIRKNFRGFLFHFLKNWQQTYDRSMFFHVHEGFEPQIGDFFNTGKYDSPSAIIADIAYNPWKKQRIILLVQGGSPNQGLF
ncbi:MAG: DUF4846 domain-containing protein, partial [Candidatus Wallbacteria bacterium]|nr:DUF4846 domain-containing protein [Candidatus Wallbacteria bacterium]